MSVVQNIEFNLVIEEFQEFFSGNSSIYSDMKNSWDQYRLKTRVNFNCQWLGIFVDEDDFRERERSFLRAQ